MRLLLLSNSTTEGFSYLEHSVDEIKVFFGNHVKKIAFIPYAAVTFSYEEYTVKVADVFSKLGYEIISVTSGNPKEIIESCDAIAVGGGNTFQLLTSIYENDLFDLIKQKVQSGVPYIGWSAGSNLACPSIMTTNDMPIVEPKSFISFSFIDYQINPHYLDAHPDGHHGETREQRILEFIALNKNIWVVGLREGSIIKVEGQVSKLLGNKSARVFKNGIETFEIPSGSSIELKHNI